MKSYTEMAQAVFCRRDEYRAAQKQKRLWIARTAASVGCVCLAALLGLGVWRGRLPGMTPAETPGGTAGTGTSTDFDNESDGGTVSAAEAQTSRAEPTSAAATNQTVGNKTSRPTLATGTQSAALQGTVSTEEKRLFHINRTESALGAATRFYSPEQHYTEVWGNARMAEHLGVDLSALSALPEGMTYAGGGSHKLTFQNDGTLVYYTASYSYEGEGQSVQVLASRVNTPYDYLYRLESDVTTPFWTENGVVEVLVAGLGDTESFEEDWAFVADFQTKGVFYRVKADNVRPRDFERLIRELIE